MENAVIRLKLSQTMNIETIRKEALSLPVEERARLAEQLLSSLDDLSEAEIDQLWLREAARRAEEMDQGLVERIPAEVVNREARALLK
jgi:putative addiction module component (TIGR02574 family)